MKNPINKIEMKIWTQAWAKAYPRYANIDRLFFPGKYAAEDANEALKEYRKQIRYE